MATKNIHYCIKDLEGCLIEETLSTDEDSAWTEYLGFESLDDPGLGKETVLLEREVDV
jgi:hypothetical protein